MQAGLRTHGSWRTGMVRISAGVGGSVLLLLLGLVAVQDERASAQRANDQERAWIDEIEKVFIRSEDCKQCHDRHYEEWKGMREQTPDLKTFGRVDAASLHGTSLHSPVFRTVLGLWLQTNPTAEQRTQCLSCHVPPVTVFPQHTEKVAAQVLTGKVEVEGIGCASCHLISGTAKQPGPPPTYVMEPGTTLFGPYADAEENMVHDSQHSATYRAANYCAACHFDKVKDVTRPDLPGEILQGTVCQDCHMEPSTGSSTSRRGAMTRTISRHWFRGVVIPGIMLRNRNLQAEWMPRLDIETITTPSGLEGTVLVRTGSLPHSFPDGDPVLKQFFLTITAKDSQGRVLASQVQRFGASYERLLRGPIPDPLVKGGTTRRIPYTLAIAKEQRAAAIEVLLTYSLIPEPEPELRERYFSTLPSDSDRETATTVIRDYAEPRVLTFRTKTISP